MLLPQKAFEYFQSYAEDRKLNFVIVSVLVPRRALQIQNVGALMLSRRTDTVDVDQHNLQRTYARVEVFDGEACASRLIE